VINLTEQTIFINTVLQDSQIARQIQDQLKIEDIPCYLPPQVTNLKDHYEVVNQIEAMVTNQSVMVVVLSQAALDNPWFVSNVQYACELAGRRTVLVILQIDDVPKDNPIGLYYAQAALLKATNQAELPLKKLISMIKRVLHRKDMPNTFHQRRLPKKVIGWAFGIAVIGAFALGVSSYFLPWYSDLMSPRLPPIATPVIFEDPFSGESIDRGITVDRRSLPEMPPSGVPQTEAPFFFQPAFIHKRFSFDDPALENLDVLNIGSQYGNRSVTPKDQTASRQIQGSLQVSLAPGEGIDSKFIKFGFPHVFSTREMPYIGVRFYLEDYAGWSDADLTNFIGFSTTFHDGHLCLIDVGRGRILNEQGEVIDESGIGWHTLEIMPSNTDQVMRIYLDGDEIGQHALDMGVDRYAQLSLNLSAPYATDWVNIYIDELVFGGERPLFKTASADEMTYLMTPDVVLYDETFDEVPAFPVEIHGSGAMVRNGTFQFSIPKGREDVNINVAIPAQPVSQMNYFSMKYRILDFQTDPWSEWGSISIRLQSLDLAQDKGYSSIGAFDSRYGAEYILQAGRNEHHGWWGSWENFQPGAWHVMEMVIKPGSDLRDQYIIQYWHDHILVGEHEIIDVEYFLGDHPFSVAFSVDSGRPRQVDFKGEIDEIMVGGIDFSGLFEEKPQ
jgi:hypothetical protein